MQLTDKEIREALLVHLRQLPVAPRAVLEEVRVHNGNAIADVVAIHRAAHCYEIKGETDAIRRIVRQGAFYDKVFRRITLVTTENHLRQADLLCPPHWGIIAAERSDLSAIKLRYVRKSSISTNFDKQVALLTLWKRELLSLCDDQIAKLDKANRQTLTNLIAEKMPAHDVSRAIGDVLISRQITNGWPIAI